MELRQLRYFIGVVDAGSLLKASARLHVAQPAVGQQIAALEHELGARLFERSSRGMHLTPAGRSFLEHAKVVLADVERARAAVRDLAAVPRGEVVVGLPTTIALAATVPLVRACRERLPQVHLKIVEAYSGFVAEWLQAGRLDLAFLYGDHGEPAMLKRALLDERLALIAGPTGAALPNRISLQRVAAHELVLPSRDHGLRRIIDEACAALGLRLSVVAEIDSLPNVKR
jgi:LysR family nitrogen assimilation transcriptional regulator